MPLAPGSNPVAGGSNYSKYQSVKAGDNLTFIQKVNAYLGDNAIQVDAGEAEQLLKQHWVACR